MLGGMHFQKRYPRVKLVCAIKGSVFDVAVDLCFNSATCGKWYGVQLTVKTKIEIAFDSERICKWFPSTDGHSGVLL